MQSFLDASLPVQALILYLLAGFALSLVRPEGPLQFTIEVIGDLVRQGLRGPDPREDLPYEAPRSWFQRPPVLWIVVLLVIPFVFAVYIIGWIVFEADALWRYWRYGPEKEDPERRDLQNLPVLPAHILTFTRIGGGGQVMCRDCRWHQDIVSYVHNMSEPRWQRFGAQCPDCGTFSTYEQIGHDPPPDSALACPACSTRMTRDNPLFCPICRSDDLQYIMTYIT